MINGKQLRDAFISGSNNLCNKKREVDALNVFPVPDGDTGTNMSMTIGNGAKALAELPDDVTVGEVSKVAAGAFLRGARGNSGVILSLLFRGFSKGLKGKETATGADIAAAITIGVEAAYKAVMKPTEGTILTVSRCAAEKAMEIAKYDDSVTAVFYGMYIEGKKTLEKTPEMLPILKKSGVVDAGGQGLVYIMEGMWNLISEGTIIPLNAAAEAAEAEEEVPKQTAKYAYCVEVVLERKNSKEAESFSRWLGSVGEVVMLGITGECIKFHVHTNEPGKVITEALTFGPLTTVKVENISVGHTTILGEEPKEEAAPSSLFPYAEVNPDIEYGFVSVCAGKGLTDVFADLGCDNIVSGGQTMNPSTESILAGIDQVPAETVFVLPNNGNIIMAAQQCQGLTEKNVVVIPSKTVPQGITAMMNVDPEAEVASITEAMTEALSTVTTSQITYAARDSDFDGFEIHQGDYLALKEGKLFGTDTQLDALLEKLAEEGKDSSFISLYYGEDVTEDAAQAAGARFQAVCPDAEISVLSGGQPVYYYIISFE